MKITRTFGDTDNIGLSKEAYLADIVIGPHSNLVIRDVRLSKIGEYTVVWAITDMGEKRLFMYNPSVFDVPIDQFKGRTIRWATELYHRMVNEALSEGLMGTKPSERREPAPPKILEPEISEPEISKPKVEKPVAQTPLMTGIMEPAMAPAHASALGMDKAADTAEIDLAKDGRAAGMTVEDIAKKHGVSVSKIREQLAKGIRVEMEHTRDEKLARKIAMDHLEEIPDYYDRLADMERGLGCIQAALLKFVKGVDRDWNYVTPQQLAEEGLKKYFIVDIRRPEDFTDGHIKGAKNIFWMELLNEENLKKLPKDEKILLVCYVGHTSSQMVVALRLLGYDAVSLKFGMGRSPVKDVPVAGWLDYGYDVET